MPDGIPDGISREDVAQAVADFDAGAPHEFHPSRIYDLVINGRAYPPKAIVGLAARRIAGRTLTPHDFKGGEGSRNFRILRDLGFDVVPKPGMRDVGFAVLTENDESQWDDETGVRYHFPSRYAKFLPTGTPVVYYKGSMKDRSYADKRLSPEPHYFGLGTIGDVVPDPDSAKGDLFAWIEDYRPFDNPVLAKTDTGFLEEIPESRVTNYWRDGVRPISEDVYDRIVHAATKQNAIPAVPEFAILPTEEIVPTTFVEGATRVVSVNAYERNRDARTACLAHYGYICMVCGFDFAKTYGEKYARKGIHVHHVKNLASIGYEYKVNPIEDLRPVCPNCHAILHAQSQRIAMEIETLRGIIAAQRGG